DDLLAGWLRRKCPTRGAPPCLLSFAGNDRRARGNFVSRARRAMTIRFHKGDLPDDADFGDSVAIDTETLGLVPHRDRLCLVQFSVGDGSADVVQIGSGQARAQNIERLLADPKITKLFHFARFDVAVLFKTFGVMAAPIYCTKIASKLARTYTDRHGLKD